MKRQTVKTDPTPVTDTTLTRRTFLKGTVFLAQAGLSGTLFSLAPARAEDTPVRTTAKTTLYLIATAHNDTQWNWTVQQTIRNFIPATMRPNWELFKKYPDYNFNYEGVIHYMFFKEYYPHEWSELQAWVKKGRWKLSGSWINAVDVCNPSAESLFRQALYGQQFFRREFGQVSRDIFLPDCFGFPYSLPTIGRHSGLIAFSTQKFDSWGGWRPSPFDVGRWRGVDGSELVSAIKPGSYSAQIRSDISTDPDWNRNFSTAGDRRLDFRYFGTGDQGGTPDEDSIRWMEKAIQNTGGRSRVINTSADQMAKDLTPAEIAALPVYDGELVMKTHGVGSYTSQAARKKWNRLNEQLADAAERASLAASLLGGPAYPQEQLTAAWVRTLWHQFHDDLPGTCIPQAYTFSWNDDLLNLNQFSQIVTMGVGAIAQHLDTRTQGVPLVVYNPLDQGRKDVVEATVTLPAVAPAVRVYDAATGSEVPSQILSQEGTKVRLLLLANAPSVGCQIYDVRPSPTSSALDTGLKVTTNELESRRYRVRINEDGDISSVYDKTTRTELLRAPSQLEERHNPSPVWPAWEVLWKTVSASPRGVIRDNVRIHIAENGPARVALAVTRTLGDSTFVQHIRLTPDGDWVEVHNEVDWRTPATLVKVAFPMTASNPVATFDIGLGTITRPNYQPNLYEVNAQQWADITDASRSHGLAILTNYKYGWDKPADNILRLTLMHTPESDNYPHQETNDIGHHQFDYALAGHAGDWRAGAIPQCAVRFNQPLQAFQTTAQEASGGRVFSLVQVSTAQVRITALKKAEESDEWVVRLQELHGESAKKVTVTFATPIKSIREINAAEESVGTYTAQDGKLVLDMTAYQPRSFAIRLSATSHKIVSVSAKSVSLPYNMDGITHRSHFQDSAFDDRGDTYAGELWPDRLVNDGISYRLGSSKSGAKNMVSCHGQRIELPEGDYNRLYFLAASANGDKSGVFTLQTSSGSTVAHLVRVQDWAEHIGQWDSRLVHPSRGDGGPQIVSKIRDGKVVGLERMRPGYVKRDNIAWVGSHRHGTDGDQAYLYSYLFQYRLDLPAGASAITLPKNPDIRLMAMTVAHNLLDDTVPAGYLFEPTLASTPPFIPQAIRHTGPPEMVFKSEAVQTFVGTGEGIANTDVTNLPTDPTAPWTINLFVYTDKQPEPLTVFGGFGDGTDTQGAQRYLIYFQGGIEFWGSNVDIASSIPLDLGKWQMITATFDGKTVRVYKNGKVIKTETAELTEAAPIVKIAPFGPWSNGHRFSGQIQRFTVWNGALDPAQITGLWSAF